MRIKAWFEGGRARASVALAAVVLAGSVGVGGASSAAGAAERQHTPLQIMITNDDGIGNAGLDAVRDALCAAGHEVTVVAPARDKSGTSAALSSRGQFTVTRGEFPCGAGTGQSWAVDDAYPGDTVLFGVEVVYGGERPDLVVSGINPGPNVGDLATNSGTVGATVTASNLGVPAIAMSVGMRPDQAAAAYPDAAAFVVDLIDQLRATQWRAETVLPRGQALNVNFPGPVDSSGVYDPTQVKGPKVTTQAASNLARFGFQETTPGVYRIAPAGCAPGSSFHCAVPAAGSDMVAMQEGYISVNPIDGDYTSGPVDRWLIGARLHGLR